MSWNASRTKRTLIAGGAALIVFATGFDERGKVAAQQMALEEIIVTARKRDESLLDIPVAVTAFTAEDIQNIGIF